MEFIFNIAIGIILCGSSLCNLTISDMTVEADFIWFRRVSNSFSVIGLFLLPD